MGVGVVRAVGAKTLLDHDDGGMSQGEFSQDEGVVDEEISDRESEGSQVGEQSDLVDGGAVSGK